MRVFAASAMIAFLGSCAQLPPGCEYTYASVYQPPTHIGGAGRMARIPTGSVCRPAAPGSAEDETGIDPASQPDDRRDGAAGRKS